MKQKAAAESDEVITINFMAPYKEDVRIFKVY